VNDIRETDHFLDPLSPDFDRYLPQLKALLAPYPFEDMTCWPVSARVGNVKNNDPSLIEPAAP
jgi:putative SOS response-associated peptidase YedK